MPLNMAPTARDGPRPALGGEWAVFAFGDIVRCPGHNQATHHACNKGLGRVQRHAEVAVRVHTGQTLPTPSGHTGPHDVQLVSVCNRCKTEIAWHYRSLRTPERGAA